MNILLRPQMVAIVENTPALWEMHHRYTMVRMQDMGIGQAENTVDDFVAPRGAAEFHLMLGQKDDDQPVIALFHKARTALLPWTPSHELFQPKRGEALLREFASATGVAPYEVQVLIVQFLSQLALRAR